MMFLPFLDKRLISNLFSGISVYFQKLEFNASIYYLIRCIGYKAVGYNLIAKAGVALAVATTISIGVIAPTEEETNRMSLPLTMLFAITCYFVFATTVHPWYIATLIALSVFAHYRYAIFWSALIPLTYIAYQTGSIQENLGLVTLEYLGVGGWLIYELILQRSKGLKFHINLVD